MKVAAGGNGGGNGRVEFTMTVQFKDNSDTIRVWIQESSSSSQIIIKDYDDDDELLDNNYGVDNTFTSRKLCAYANQLFAWRIEEKEKDSTSKEEGTTTTTTATTAVENYGIRLNGQQLLEDETKLPRTVFVLGDDVSKPQCSSTDHRRRFVLRLQFGSRPNGDVTWELVQKKEKKNQQQSTRRRLLHDNDDDDEDEDDNTIVIIDSSATYWNNRNKNGYTNNPYADAVLMVDQCLPSDGDYEFQLHYYYDDTDDDDDDTKKEEIVQDYTIFINQKPMDSSTTRIIYMDDDDDHHHSSIEITPFSIGTPSPPPAVVFPGGLCFAGGSSTVQVQGKGIVPISELRIGDYVRVVDVDDVGGTGIISAIIDTITYEQVYAFGHYAPDTTSGDFVRLETNHSSSSSSSSIVLSPDHMIPIVKINSKNKKNGRPTTIQFVPASKVQIGDQVIVTRDDDNDDGVDDANTNSVVVVTAIQYQVQEKGLYAPFTKSGTIVVNTIVASNYVALNQESHISLLELFGSTMMMEGNILLFQISNQWLAHAVVVSTYYYYHYHYWLVLLYPPWLFGLGKKNNEIDDDDDDHKELLYNDDGIALWLVRPLQLGLWILKKKNE